MKFRPSVHVSGRGPCFLLERQSLNTARTGQSTHQMSFGPIIFFHHTQSVVFLCLSSSSSCEDGVWHCDGVACPHPVPTCQESEFSCASGLCVPSEWLCDNEDDCGDGTDEICPFTCSPEHFRCASTPRYGVTLTLAQYRFFP